MFSRKGNLIRHMQSVHKSGYNADENDETMDEEENYSETESEEQTSSDSSEDDDESDEDDEETTYWREIIIEAADYVEFNEPKDLLHEPYLSALVEEMREIVEERLEFSNHMKKHNEIYERIIMAKKRYKDESEEIASQTAWSDKRFVLKQVIAENMDIFDEIAETDENQEDTIEQD